MHLRLILVLASVLGLAAYSAAEPAAPAPAKTPPPDALAAAKSVESATEQAADKVAPAVVNILISRQAVAMPDFDEDMNLPDNLPPELHDQLKEYFKKQWHDAPELPFKSRGNGSGVLISGDGFILTSEHVIRGATTIEATVSTRKKYQAKVVGADPRRDLAVIKIDAKDLPSAKLGDASVLRRGQFVLALGSPFGFGRDGQASLSFGIVSGTGRAIPGIGREADRYYGNLIQTDAAVNPGNSGGPLINLDGEVVGINAVISSRDGSSDGVGFAVPIDELTKSIIDRLKAGKEIVYGFLGVEIQEVDEENAKVAGVEEGEGAWVASVLQDTPAAKAGLKAGDVILKVGGAAVHDPDDVIRVVQSTPVGDKVALTVFRAKKTEEMKVEVARRPVPETLRAERRKEAEPGAATWRGLRVEPLTKDLRSQSNLPPEQEGVFVREVRDGSAAAQAGIQPGMVIDQVADKKVASVKDFKAAAPAASEAAVAVRVVGKGAITVPGPGGKKEEPKKEEPKK